MKYQCILLLYKPDYPSITSPTSLPKIRFSKVCLKYMEKSWINSFYMQRNHQNLCIKKLNWYSSNNWPFCQVLTFYSTKLMTNLHAPFCLVRTSRFWFYKKFIIFCKHINLHFMYFWTQHLTLTRIFLNFSCPCMYWCLLQSHNETYGLLQTSHFREMSVIIYSKRLQNVTIVIVNYFTSKITTIIMIKMEPNQSH